MAHIGDYTSYIGIVVEEYQFLLATTANTVDEFSYKPYSVVGTILDKNGIPASRTVIAINEFSNKVESIIESDPASGEYVSRMSTTDPHILIFTGEEGRNVIAYGRVIPNE